MATTTPTLTERAAKARAEADQLDLEARRLQRADDLAQRALVARQKPVVEAATVAAVNAALATIDKPKDPPRLWADLAADENVGLDELFKAWVALRSASASRASAVSTAGNIIDATTPTFDADGRLIPARQDRHDILSEATLWPELEAIIALRVKAAAARAGQAIAQVAQDAGNAASARIK